MSFDKHTNDVKIGIAISTFSQLKTDPHRYQIIKQSLDSLTRVIQNTKLNIYIAIIVDGPIPLIHNQILNQYKFNIFRRKENGGVARTKNTCIKLLLDQKIDIGFLADDDVLYKKNCLEKYVNTIIDGKIHHMSFVQMHPLVHPKSEWKKMKYYQTKINNIEVMNHEGYGVGCWMSFTPELIRKIGYFKVMSGKYGYEHINFSHRCVANKMIPFVSDIINSLEYLDHLGFIPEAYNKFKKFHSITEDYRKSENNKNKNEWNINLNEFIKFID